MKRLKTGFRAILRSWAKPIATQATRNLLGAILCLLTLWSGPAIAARTAAPYTDLQRAQVEKFQAPLLAAQERMGELRQSVIAEDWTNTRNFIHGPLGEMRRYLSNISRNLPEAEQGKARTQAKELMSHVERLDAAANEGDSRSALKEYDGTVSGLEAFLQLMP